MSDVGEAYDHLDGHRCAACGCGVDGDGMCPCGCMEPTCPDCGHCHTPDGCTGPPTPSDRWAGVSPSACDCDRWHSKHRSHCATNYSEGVGTGAGEGATGQDTGTAWVTRSTDCPEAPAQAHLPSCPCNCVPGICTEGDECCESHECPGLCGEHHWLDRPESDTRVCELCGEER